jgi:hypothetical protein
MRAKAAWLLVGLSLPLLIAATGGFPSRPRFQSVGVNAAAPASGNLTASGTVIATNVQANAAVVPDADAGATVGTNALRFSEVHSTNYCEGDCSTTRFIDSTGTTARFGNGSAWTSISLPRPTVVTGGSMSVDNANARMFINDTSGAGASLLAFYDNGVGRGFVGSANGASNCVTGDTQGDVCLRAESGVIRFTTNGGTSSAMVIDASGNVAVGGSIVRSGAFQRVAHARINSAGTLLAGSTGITSTVRNSVGNYTVNYTAAGFTSIPSCTASATDIYSGAISSSGGGATLTSVSLVSIQSGSTNVDSAMTVICMGQ